MKVLLLGATGRTGKHVLQEAIRSNYEITCVSRNSGRLPKINSITAIEGDPLDQKTLTEAMAGCDAIISVLNISRTSDFPWSKLRTPESYLSEVMTMLISIAEKAGTKRLIVCSAWGVAETKKDIPNWFKWFIDSSNIGVAYADHEKQEQVISDSKLNWTIVRPVGLYNGKVAKNLKVSKNDQPKPSLLISRKSVAKYMIECLSKDELIGQKVVISKT